MYGQIVCSGIWCMAFGPSWAFCCNEGIDDGKIVCLGFLGVWLAGLLGILLDGRHPWNGTDAEWN